MTYSIKMLLMFTGWVGIILGAGAWMCSLPVGPFRYPLDAIITIVTMIFATATIGAFVCKSSRRQFCIGYWVANSIAYFNWIIWTPEMYFGTGKSRPPMTILTNWWISHSQLAWAAMQPDYQEYSAALETLIKFGLMPLVGIVGGYVALRLSQRFDEHKSDPSLH